MPSSARVGLPSGLQRLTRMTSQPLETRSGHTVRRNGAPDAAAIASHMGPAAPSGTSPSARVGIDKCMYVDALTGPCWRFRGETDMVGWPSVGQCHPSGVVTPQTQRRTLSGGPARSLGPAARWGTWLRLVTLGAEGKERARSPGPGCSRHRSRVARGRFRARRGRPPSGERRAAVRPPSRMASGRDGYQRPRANRSLGATRAPTPDSVLLAYLLHPSSSPPLLHYPPSALQVTFASAVSPPPRGVLQPWSFPLHLAQA
jgi:hypothetical protein